MPEGDSSHGASEEQGANEDLKAKMRAALDRKKRARHPTAGDAAAKGAAMGAEKAHGPEVTGGAAPKMHRRKAGGGGA